MNNMLYNKAVLKHRMITGGAVWGRIEELVAKKIPFYFHSIY